MVVLLLATSGAKVGHGVLELDGGKVKFGGACKGCLMNLDSHSV